MKAVLTAFPAYGRQYTTPERMREDFLNGKDFSASQRGGPYFSIRDFTDNENCKDFDQVHICQHRTRVSVTITRDEMVEHAVKGAIKQYLQTGKEVKA